MLWRREVSALFAVTHNFLEEPVSESITDKWLSSFMLIDDDDEMSHYAQKRIALMECTIFGILLLSLPHTELPKITDTSTDVVSMALSFNY